MGARAEVLEGCFPGCCAGPANLRVQKRRSGRKRIPLEPYSGGADARSDKARGPVFSEWPAAAVRTMNGVAQERRQDKAPKPDSNVQLKVAKAG